MAFRPAATGRGAGIPPRYSLHINVLACNPAFWIKVLETLRSEREDWGEQPRLQLVAAE
jgi:hypothetical protein